MKKIINLLLTTILFVSMVGCSNSSTNTETNSTNNEKTGIKVGVLMKTMSDTYSNKLGETIQQYFAENYPDDELILMDGQADIAKQISQAEDLIALNVNVIILNPQDADGSAQVLDLANEANIPVIEVNTETVRTDYVAYVGSDDVKAGEIMGKFIEDNLKNGQYAILEGEMGQSAQLKRYEGLENTILKNSELECVATLSANWSRDKAMATTEDWLAKYPDLKAIICENDDMAMGALQASESQNREMLIIGTDAIPDALKAVKEGRLSATVLQDATGQAQTAVDVAVKVANGEKVESYYEIDFQLITKDNVDDFLK